MIKSSHQIKLSRAELTKIVGHAMGSIDKEIGRIKKPYSIIIFVKALGSFLNFISECYYTVKRIPVAYKLYKHSWFGTRTPIAGAAGQRHPDDVYIKIIQKTSFKIISAQLAAVRELTNWLGKKQEGIKAHLKKNIGNYLKKEKRDVYSEHQKNFLVPLLMKLVKDDKQQKVADAIASFPQFMIFLQANFPLLQDMFDNKLADFEKEALGFLQQIPGLQDLTNADFVNYPQKMGGVQSAFAGGFKTILGQFPQLKTDLTTQLTAFLKNDFNKYLSAFISYPQAQALTQLLNKDNNARSFVVHCVKKLMDGNFEYTEKAIIAELKIFFPALKFTTLDEDQAQIKSDFLVLQDEVTKELSETMSAETTAELVSIITGQLLPALVNLYPSQYRAKLLSLATHEKIRSLLLEHGSILLNAGDKDPAKLADFIFSKLQKGTLPAPIDTAKELEKAKKLFDSEFKWIKKKSHHFYRN